MTIRLRLTLLFVLLLAAIGLAQSIVVYGGSSQRLWIIAERDVRNKGQQVQDYLRDLEAEHRRQGHSVALTSFDALPRVVRFPIGFATPTQYINWQNTDLRSRPFDGEEAQRGVQVRRSGSTVAQVTLHVDIRSGTPSTTTAAELFFDQIAAAIVTSVE